MPVSTQFLKFLLTGGVAAGVNLLTRYCLDLFLSFEISVALAFLVAMATAYVLARLFVFDASGRSAASEFYRFTVVNLFALVLVWGVSVGLARIIFPRIGFSWYADDVAHAIGVFAPAVTSFVGHRYYTFRRERA